MNDNGRLDLSGTSSLVYATKKNVALGLPSSALMTYVAAVAVYLICCPPMVTLPWVTELFSSGGGAGRCCPACPVEVGGVVWDCCSAAPRPRPRWGGSVCACARQRASSMVIATANKPLIFVSPLLMDVNHVNG